MIDYDKQHVLFHCRVDRIRLVHFEQHGVYLRKQQKTFKTVPCLMWSQKG
jgi:hypothetical protein